MSGRGGWRPGAGRPRKHREMPHEYALRVMRDPAAKPRRRDAMAIALLNAFGSQLPPEPPATDAEEEARR